MALVNTIAANVLQPHVGGLNDVTKEYWQYLQTSGSAVTQGGVEIFADPSTTNNFILSNLIVDFVNPTASAQGIAYLGVDKIATFPTMAAGVTVHNPLNFGSGGIRGGTTTTATVSIFTTVGTSTVQFVASGYRKK